MDIIFIFFGVLVVGLLLIMPWYKDRKARFAPFSEADKQILQQQVPMYQKLPDDLKLQLHLLVNSFLHRKKFYGCQGLEVTRTMQLTIAAQACLLLLNRPTQEFRKLKAILVYPAAFVATHRQVDANGLVSYSSKELAGESWGNGRVILSWDDVTKGAQNIHDGKNVVLHEFAHQLDSEDGATNGAPELASANAYRTWASLMSAEFAQLQQAQIHHLHSVMDYYGASEPAEFFAVATETFFEKPNELKQKHSELYELFCQYYKVSPDEW